MATPLRAIRISNKLWTRALAVAEERETTVSAVVRDALVDFVGEDPDADSAD